MKNFFKKYFIPHHKNDYKPHLFRAGSIVKILSFVLIIFAAALYSPTIFRVTDMTALVLPRVLIDYANNDRLAENYSGLTLNPVLQKAAQMKANDMALKGYFAHNSPDGHTPWYWFNKAGYDFSYAGENLAVNFSDSSDVNNAWMNSPSHRQNIMNGNFTEIGVATAGGIFQGKPTTFVVQLFGTPAKETVSTNTKSKIVPLKTQTKTTLAAVASSSVLGESTNNIYVAVENKSAVKPDSSVAPTYSSWLEKIILSPKKLLSFLYLVIAIIVIIGLMFTIFIEIKKQHPFSIFSALFVLIVICLLFYTYKSALFNPLLIV